MFDGTIGAGWSWSQRDGAMARRILAALAAGAGTLAVAGNAHTPITGTRLGLPLGACIARQRPGVREIRISYGAGRYDNIQPRRFRSRIGLAAVTCGCTSRTTPSSWTCPRPVKRSFPSARRSSDGIATAMAVSPQHVAAIRAAEARDECGSGRWPDLNVGAEGREQWREGRGIGVFEVKGVQGEPGRR